MSGVRCPECRGPRSQVLETRQGPGDYSRRRRRCLGCGEKYTTYEVAANEFDAIGTITNIDKLVSVAKRLRDAVAEVAPLLK